MKKFLSILLAVMMILSTVSFAAPSAVGTMDAATESPVVEVPEVVLEETADLAATAGDKSSYGTLVYSVDFERDDFDVDAFSVAYCQVSKNPITAYLNPDFPTSNLTVYTNAAGDGFSNAALVTEDGNTYIQGDVNTSYDGFFRMTKYNCAWPEGYYTFAVDVKIPAGQASSWAKQCNDTAIALTTLRDFKTTEGGWQTVVYQTTNVVDGNAMYGYFVTPNNASAGTVAYDNWEVYYRPATVKLTIAGTEYEVSTDNKVTVASLSSYVTAPTGYILDGFSLTEGGALIEDQYFFEDTTLYPSFIKDPYSHDVYGKALFVIDFENASAQNWWGNSSGDNSNVTYGAQVWEVAKYYDARFANGANYRVRLTVNENTHIDQGCATEENGNYYNLGTSYTQWPQLVLSNWGSVKGDAGIYTLVADTMIDKKPASFATNAGAGWTLVDTFDGKLNTWDHLVATNRKTEAGNVPDGANVLYYSLDAADKGVAKVGWDNIAMYYKPFTADVTLVYGDEEYVAEDVSTEGVSAASILAKAGVEIPYGKKAVLSATKGGESVGNLVTLVADTTLYVSFVADDSISEYGKRLFLIDFENMNVGDVLKDTTDNLSIDKYTDDFDADWAHLTINWEAGTNTIVEEEGNKIIKGQQNYAQVRIGNANFASAPAGYYTMSYKVKNYGTEEKYLATKDQNAGVNGTWVKANASVVNTTNNYLVVNGQWNEVAAEWDYAGKDYTIYHTAAMTTDIAFDDVALYYRPATVNLTVVNGTEETVYENCDTTVDVDALLADIEAPFGYKAALSTEKNGAPITGTLNLVSDAKLYVVYVADETLDFEYGNALFIIDFEREDMQGWDGNSQEINNSVANSGAYVYESATYYDSRFQGKNYRVRFVINEAPVTDQAIVADAKGNYYVTGTNTTQWSQIASTNWGNIQGEAGYYTFMYDVKVDATTESNIAMTHAALHDGTANIIDGFSTTVGEWDTVIAQVEMASAGNIPKGTWGNFNFAAKGTTTLSFDNAKLFYKPYLATVKVVANGEVVATKNNVATDGTATVAALIDGVSVRGYDITGVTLGEKAYGTDSTIVLPGNCEVALILEAKDISAATPATAEEKSIRVDDPVGIRFKAELTKSAMDETTEYGWIVTRESLLEAAGIAAEDFTLDSAVNKVSGWNYGNGTEVAKIFDEDDEYAWFTAILYFSATEEDGLPSVDKLAGKLVARPFVKNGGEYLYGDATAPASIFDVALALFYNEEQWNNLGGDVQTYIEDILYKCDEDANDIPDILE